MDIINIPVMIRGGGFDKQGDRIAEDCEISFNGTVCLVHDFKNNLAEAIGTAHLKVIGNTILADLYLIDDSLPYRLLTPAVGGKILKSIDDIKTRRKIITKMHINVVSLNVSDNADPRIKRIGDL